MSGTNLWDRAVEAAQEAETLRRQALAREQHAHALREELNRRKATNKVALMQWLDARGCDYDEQSDGTIAFTPEALHAALWNAHAGSSFANVERVEL